MSQKTTTTTANQFNAGAMGNYNMFQGSLGRGLTSFASNPLGSSFFQNQLGAGLSNAGAIMNRNNMNMFSNLRTGGGLIGNSGAFMQSQLNRSMLSNSGIQSNVFNSSLNSALANQRWALGSMQAYNPLQTGQTTTQQQSSGVMGVLGPLAAAGLNIAMPGIGSMLGGAAFKDGYS